MCKEIQNRGIYHRRYFSD